MTSSVSIMGTYSGITMDTIDQLIQAESGKLTQYTNQQTELTNEKNAWKDINTRLDTLYKKFDALKAAETFDSKTVSNSNEKTVKVTANTNSVEGVYKVSVQRLATSSQVTSGAISALTGKKSTEALSLSGTLTLTTANSKDTENPDSKSFSIDIAEGDSIKDIVTKINETAKETKSGLTASIIDNRLVLMDSDMGERTIEITDANQISGEESLTSKLGLEGVSTVLGQSAKLSVNGIEMERNTNSITDAVEGLTFDLVSVSETDSVSTIKVVEDAEKTTKAVQEFVDQYNSTMSFIDTQLDVGNPAAEGNTTGALTGDSSLMRLQSQLRSLVTSSSKDANQSIKGLSDLGVEVDRYGKATLDTTKLKEALAENSNDVQSFFFKEDPVLDASGTSTGEKNTTGLAQQMTSFINEYIGEKTGIIMTKSATIDDMIEDLDEQITKFNERLEKKRERYITQFTALDVAMMEAESQMSYLNSQLGISEE
ncbi:flagellar filament capping protein FliD [Desemzia sp. FAM 23991]|uniref:flagellar filament capping protein FliD n=1 Tax=unclassified Desemzia TaxID=2685243 RepID=UPI0038888F66